MSLLSEMPTYSNSYTVYVLLVLVVVLLWNICILILHTRVLYSEYQLFSEFLIKLLFYIDSVEAARKKMKKVEENRDPATTDPDGPRKRKAPNRFSPLPRYVRFLYS